MRCKCALGLSGAKVPVASTVTSKKKELGVYCAWCRIASASGRGCEGSATGHAKLKKAFQDIKSSRFRSDSKSQNPNY